METIFGAWFWLTMTEPLDYMSIFRGFNKATIDYLIVGGLAVNFHGIPRMTYAIDIMMLLERQNVHKMVSLLESWGYKARLPVDATEIADESVRERWIKEKNWKALTFYNDEAPVMEIDLMIDVPMRYEELKERAVVFTVGGESVPVISIEDLIELKKRVDAGRICRMWTIC
jgi:hypothetical protein